MANELAGRQPERQQPRSLAEKVNWLIDHAHPAGRGPYSNAEVVALIEKATGEVFSHTTIWKLRNGQSKNPHKRLIEALGRRSASRRPTSSMTTTSARPGCLRSKSSSSR